MDRTTLDEDWRRLWDRHVRTAYKERAEIFPEIIGRLEHFASHGETGAPPIRGAPLDVRRGWEQDLYLSLYGYADWLVIDLELSAVEQRFFDVGLASRAFAARYTSFTIEAHTHAMFPHRFSGRSLRVMSMQEIPYSALGVVIGAFDKAFELGRLQLAAVRNGYYFDNDSYPIFGFMLKLLADQLGASSSEVSTLAHREPVLGALLDRWREPDPNAVSDLCVAVCDLHTHSCLPTKQREFVEFGHGIWMRTPIEILLLFKLRQLNGLTNPEIEHPLMMAPFGTLPPEIGFKPDDLVTRVRDRMARDGYDEKAIADLVLDSGGTVN